MGAAENTVLEIVENLESNLDRDDPNTTLDAVLLADSFVALLTTQTHLRIYFPRAHIPRGLIEIEHQL